MFYILQKLIKQFSKVLFSLILWTALKWAKNSVSSIIQCWEAVTQTCSLKKVFLEIWQNSQKNTCARVSFLNKVAGRTAPLLKRDSCTGVFLWIRVPVNLFSCFPVQSNSKVIAHAIKPIHTKNDRHVKLWNKSL